jgi:3-deoxy-D-manno-octulosonic-acid transferase
MIQALGELKDKGLIQENTERFLDDQSSRKNANKRGNKLIDNHQEISEKALRICDQFFIKDNIPGRLADDLQENKR